MSDFGKRCKNRIRFKQIPKFDCLHLGMVYSLKYSYFRMFYSMSDKFILRNEGIIL